MAISGQSNPAFGDVDLLSSRLYCRLRLGVVSHAGTYQSRPVTGAGVAGYTAGQEFSPLREAPCPEDRLL